MRGGDLARDFGEVEQLQVSVKGPSDFVSAADRRAEEIIHDELAKARPNYGFLMEERGTVEGKDPTHRWIVDPLDGTTNFLHGIPLFCTSIALERNGEIVAGIIYNPVSDELFTAERGPGGSSERKAYSGRHAIQSGELCHRHRSSPPGSWQPRYISLGMPRHDEPGRRYPPNGFCGP